jgi:hypothetical protein
MTERYLRDDLDRLGTNAIAFISQTNGRRALAFRIDYTVGDLTLDCSRDVPHAALRTVLELRDRVH